MALPETPELPTIGEAGAPFNPLHAVRSIGFSLFVNGVCPYILYRVLQPHYPADSVMPLVYASVFPLLGLVLGHIRTRMIDFIAVLALFEISYNIATALAASNVHWAIVLRSSEGFFVATAFLVLTLTGYPPIFYIARQFATASGPAMLRDFETANAIDKRRTFVIASFAWVGSILFQTSLNLGLAVTVTPANYLLIAQFLNTGISAAMIVWTIRFTTTRLERYRPPAAV
ncbi:MAG TPA: VC0807 family protein [Rhizomicrobium sp.]|nr:VC0807 family protein [Rhizomicrobium sp.]